MLLGSRGGWLSPSCVLYAPQKSIQHPSGARSKPVYNNVRTWPKGWKEKDIRKLLKDHLPPGVEPNWRLLTFNFKYGTTEGLDAAQTLLNNLFNPVEMGIDDLLKGSPKFELKRLTSPECPKACDMGWVTTFVRDAFTTINDGQTDLQFSMAAVIETASGIGKTFATLTSAITSR